MSTLDGWFIFVDLTWVCEGVFIVCFCAYFFVLNMLDVVKLKRVRFYTVQRQEAVGILARSALNRGIWAALSVFAGLTPYLHPEKTDPVSIGTGLFAIALQTMTLAFTVRDYIARARISQGGWRV